MSKQGHPYAEILRAIADGKEIQWFSPSHNIWQDQSTDETLDDIIGGILSPENYRAKPSVILINDLDVPAPYIGRFDIGDPYYCVDFTQPDGFMRSVWCSDDADNFRMSSGVIHKTQEAAVMHAKALLSFTKQKDKEE